MFERDMPENAFHLPMESMRNEKSEYSEKNKRIEIVIKIFKQKQKNELTNKGPYAIIKSFQKRYKNQKSQRIQSKRV